MAPASRKYAFIGLLAAAVLAFGAGCGNEESESPATAAEAPAAPAEPESEPVARIAPGDLVQCEGKPKVGEGFRCGTIDVPKFRSAPEKGDFEVGFAVRPRDDRRSPSQGTIVAVEGGPGYATTWSFNIYRKLFRPLLEHRDLVLVDMRGTGRSGPVKCPDVQNGTAPQWIALSECARRLGEDWEAYNTGAAAEDIDAIREALGLGQITLYGDSYGTFLAQSYAFRHPDELEALVLDSAYPVAGENPWYPSLITTGSEGMEIACKRSPNCSGDAGKRIEEAVEYMREKGMSVGKLIDAIAGAAGNPPQSYVGVDRAITKLLDGRPRAWRRLNQADSAAFGNRFNYSAPGELIVGCNDYPMIWDRDVSEEERRVQLEQSIRDYDRDAFAPFTPREVALAADVGYIECLTWPQPTELREPPVKPGMKPTEAPVLVVSGELDDLTTPFEGRLVAEQFPDARRFVARNAGHVEALYETDGPAARTIRRFLREVYAD